LAGLRSLPEVSRVEQIPQFLAGEARGPAALGHGGTCALDQAGRDPRGRRRIPFALSSPETPPVTADANGLILLPLSEHSGRGRTCYGFAPVVRDRAARLAAIPAGESPANRGVQSLL